MALSPVAFAAEPEPSTPGVGTIDTAGAVRTFGDPRGRWHPCRHTFRVVPSSRPGQPRCRSRNLPHPCRGCRHIRSRRSRRSRVSSCPPWYRRHHDGARMRGTRRLPLRARFPAIAGSVHASSDRTVRGDGRPMDRSFRATRKGCRDPFGHAIAYKNQLRRAAPGYVSPAPRRGQRPWGTEFTLSCGQFVG